VFSNTKFNSYINSWDTSTVQSATGMFADAVMFNTDLSGWQTSNIETMEGMFRGATQFNQDISGWSTISLASARIMFQDATAFNQDLSKWILTNLVQANLMFNRATAFNQNICWDFPALGEQKKMFYGSEGGLNCCKDNSEFFRKKWRDMKGITCLDIHNMNAGGQIRRDLCLSESEFENKIQQTRGWCPNACGSDCSPTASPTMWPTKKPTSLPTLPDMPTKKPTKKPTSLPTLADMTCINTPQFHVSGSRYGFTRDIVCTPANIKTHKERGKDACAALVAFGGEQKHVRDWCPKVCLKICCEDSDTFVRRYDGKNYECNTPGIEKMCEFDAVAGDPKIRIKEKCPSRCGFDCTRPNSNKSRDSQMNEDPKCKDNHRFRIFVNGKKLSCEDTRVRYKVCNLEGRLRKGGQKKLVREWCSSSCGTC